MDKEVTLPIYETFAKRKRKAEQAGKPVIFRQHVLPEQFRVQVIHIWDDMIDAGGRISDPFGVRSLGGDLLEQCARYPGAGDGSVSPVASRQHYC